MTTPAELVALVEAARSMLDGPADELTLERTRSGTIRLTAKRGAETVTLPPMATTLGRGRRK